MGGGPSRCSVGHSCSGTGGGVAAAAAGSRPLQVLQQARQKVSHRPRAAIVGVTSCHALTANVSPKRRIPNNKVD